MNPLRLFALAIVGTIFVTRMWLHARPTPSPTVAGFRLHHWMTGLAVAIGGFLAGSPLIGGVGAGLCLDEASFVARGGQNHADYEATLRVTVSLAMLIAVVLWVAVPKEPP